MRLDPGTYMIARFMFFYKPGVTDFQLNGKKNSFSARFNLVDFRDVTGTHPPIPREGELGGVLGS